MNKKILGFSLVSNMLAGSVSGVVSAEDFSKQLYFLAPKDGSIPEKVVVAINHAVTEWNDLCRFVWSYYSEFSEKEQNILKKIEEKKKKVLALRKKADDLIKSEKCEKEIIIKPWDDEQKVSEVKENYKSLFNLEGHDPLFDDMYNLNELYGLIFEICEDSEIKDMAAIGGRSSKLKDNSKLSRLNADYQYYSNMIAKTRKDFRNSNRISVFEEIELILYFQARQCAKVELDKEKLLELNREKLSKFVEMRNTLISNRYQKKEQIKKNEKQCVGYSVAKNCNIF